MRSNTFARAASRSRIASCGSMPSATRFADASFEPSIAAPTDF
jgi:hypothetical protein